MVNHFIQCFKVCVCVGGMIDKKIYGLTVKYR